MLATRNQNLQVVKYRYYRLPLFRSQISAIEQKDLLTFDSCGSRPRGSLQIEREKTGSYAGQRFRHCPDRQCYQSGEDRRKIDRGFDRETKL
jgi:hypothetical protein